MSHSLLDASLTSRHVRLHVPRGVVGYGWGTTLALAAAVLFAIGSVVQHEAALASTDGRGLRLRSLVARPAWMASQGATVAASGAQVAALALAPVSIVQPVLASGLVIALAMNCVRRRRWPGKRQVAGALATAVGLAVFLVAARPAIGGAQTRPHAVAVWLAVAVTLAVVTAAAALLRGAAGALGAGTAAGLALGVAAVLVSAALKILSHQGWVAMVGSAALWGAIAMALTAQYASQLAFSRASLSWSLPALTVVDPLAAVPVARLLLGERLQPGHAPVWVTAGIVAVAGVLALTAGES